MPMRDELSVPRLERHSVRSDNKEFLLIATLCILGLTVSIFIAVVCQASEPAILCSPSKRLADRGFVN